MRNRLMVWAAVPALALALAACSGGGSDGGEGQLTPEAASEALTGLGCESVDTQQDTDDSGIAFTLVGCQLGEDGAIVVNIVDEGAGSIQEVVCRDTDANSESAELEIVTGTNWVGIVFTPSGPTVAEVATALGGQTSTVAEYCA